MKKKKTKNKPVERSIYILYYDDHKPKYNVNDEKGPKINLSYSDGGGYTFFGEFSDADLFKTYVHGYLKEELKKAHIDGKITHRRGDLHRGFCQKEIPRGYDAYILHLSQTSKESIADLRKKQPWCLIYVMTGGDISKNLRKMINGDCRIGPSLRGVVEGLSKLEEKLEKC